MGDEVRNKVLADLSTFSHVPVEKIKDTDRLKQDLNLNHTDLVFLAMSLRSFIQHRKPSATLKVAEIEKDGMTVADLVKLVQEKVKP
jgi:acyl carrier protein